MHAAIESFQKVDLDAFDRHVQPALHPLGRVRLHSAGVVCPTSPKPSALREFDEPLPFVPNASLGGSHSASRA